MSAASGCGDSFTGLSRPCFGCVTHQFFDKSQYRLAQGLGQPLFASNLRGRLAIDNRHIHW